MKIPFNKFNSFYLSHKGKILEKTEEILESGRYIRDTNIIELEENIAKICERKYAITTASCTDALFFSLLASGIKPGDEVILPDYSYIASLSPVLMCGATPVFADINLQSLTLNIENIQNIITEKTKAIVFVQLFGISIDLCNLKDFLNSKNIVLIEDSAQALGSYTNKIPGGKFGDISCISFDPTKIVYAFGTGGVVLTDNKNVYDTVLKLTHHGRNSNGDFDILGYNSKIPALNGALISMQLEKLDDTVQILNKIANKYIEELSNIKEISIIKPLANQKSAYHKFVILAEERNELAKYLKHEGIETRIHYSVLLSDQLLMKNYKFKKNKTQNAEHAKDKALSLPIYPELKINEIDYICKTISNFYNL